MSSSIFKTASSDFKLIFRDPSLRIFFFMPLIIVGVVAWFCPYLAATYPATADYMIYVVILSCTQAATMYGFIYSIVFLDEKDSEVAKVYGILPISKNKLLLGRLLLPYVLSALSTFVVLLAQPFFTGYSWAMWGLFSLLFAFMAPIMALAVASLAGNKMEGMTWYKGLNLLVVLPVAAFFVPDYAYCFAFLPTFWPYWSLYHFLTIDNYSLFLGIAFVVLLLFLVGLGQLFKVRNFRY
jgi:fluoroquinolone transport system permease protein